MKKIFLIFVALFSIAACSDSDKEIKPNSMATVSDAERFIGDYTTRAMTDVGKIMYTFHKNDDNVTFTFVDIGANYIMKCTPDKWRIVVSGTYTEKPCLHFDCLITNRVSKYETRFADFPKIVQSPYVAFCPENGQWGVQVTTHFFEKNDYPEMGCDAPLEFTTKWTCPSWQTHLYKVEN